MANELATPDPSLIVYLQVLRRRRAWVIALVSLCLAATLVYGFAATKKYSADSQLLVQPSSGIVSLNGSSVTISPTDVLTAIELATSASVKQGVAKELGSAPEIAVTEVGQTNVIQLTATSPSPREAVKIANAYAVNFVLYERQIAESNLTAAESQLQSQITSVNSQVTSLQNQNSSSASVANQVAALLNQESVLKEQLAQLDVSGAASPGGLEVVSPATIPKSPSSPRPLEDAFIGVVVGLVLGIVAAFLVDYLKDRVFSTDDLERICPDVPLMGIIPVVTSWRDSKKTVVATMAEPRSPAAESYRSLRTSLQFAGFDDSLQTILVTSPSATEGKSSTVSNMAVVFAGAGESVVVVSTDLRRPRLGQFFGLNEEVGLTSVLLGKSSLTDAIQTVEGVEHVSLLGTGPLPPNPAELLQSSDTTDLLESLKKDYDRVLIDSPPVLPVTDAAILTKRADTVLLVVAAGRTKRADLAHAIETLNQVNAPRIGVVLNAVSRESRYGYRYGYRYQYGDSPDYAAATVGNGAASNGNGLTRESRVKQLPHPSK